MNYEQTLQRLAELKASLESKSREATIAQEFLKLKRSLCKFPEYKLRKEAKDAKALRRP